MRFRTLTLFAAFLFGTLSTGTASAAGDPGKGPAMETDAPQAPTAHAKKKGGKKGSGRRGGQGRRSGGRKGNSHATPPATQAVPVQNPAPPANPTARSPATPSQRRPVSNLANSKGRQHVDPGVKKTATQGHVSPGKGSSAHRTAAKARADHLRHVKHVRHRVAASRHRTAVAHRRAVTARHAARARHVRAHRAWRARVRHHWRWWRPARRPGRWIHYHPWWRPRWAWGVFYYGPRPVHGSGAPPAQADVPERKVDRTHSLSVGLRGGSYLSGYEHGADYGDFGMGLAARYRAAEALGFELAWMYHDNTWNAATERINRPLSASVELFAFPWARVNPYVLAGVTLTDRNYTDQTHAAGEEIYVERDDTLFGPHGGLGLEFGVGRQASVNFEWRFVGYLDKEPDDPSIPGAMQGTMGANFYF